MVIRNMTSGNAIGLSVRSGPSKRPEYDGKNSGRNERFGVVLANAANPSSAWIQSLADCFVASSLSGTKGTAPPIRDGQEVCGRPIRGQDCLGLATWPISAVRLRPRSSSIGKRCAFPDSRPTAIALFAASQGAKRHERCGIGTIIPPMLPPGIGDFVGVRGAERGIVLA